MQISTTQHSDINTINNTQSEEAFGRQSLLDGMSFISPTRKLIGYKPNSVSLTNLVSLEDIRDLFGKVEAAQQSKDMLVNLNHCAFNFEGRIARLIVIKQGRNGERMMEEPLFFDRHGWGQLCSFLLPNRGNNFIREMVHLNPHDAGDQRVQLQEGFAKMAAATMMAFTRCTDKLVQLRTVLKPIGINPVTGQRETARFIRAVVSPSYAPYSNKQVVNTLLDEMGNHSVYRYDLADSGMFLRLVDASTTGGKIELKEQYPVINAWNSETGQKQVGVGAGTFKWWCLNGCGDYRQTSNFQRKHTGDPSVIGNMLADSLVSIRTANGNLIRQFRQAQDIVIDDAFDWINNVLNSFNGITQKTIQGVQAAMKDETSGNIGTLDNVVNGMTLLAHNPDYGFSGDLWDQIELEKSASKVLARGIRQAENNKLFAPKIEA